MACKLHRKGARNKDDLTEPKYNDMLSDAQKKGVKYHADIERRIPRARVSQIGEHIQRLAVQVAGCGAQAMVCGSYRRQEHTRIPSLLSNSPRTPQVVPASHLRLAGLVGRRHHRHTHGRGVPSGDPLKSAPRAQTPRYWRRRQRCRRRYYQRRRWRVCGLWAAVRPRRRRGGRRR